jgi:hypothetical protein
MKNERIHTIQLNDTVGLIADRFGISRQQIQSWNPSYNFYLSDGVLTAQLYEGDPLVVGVGEPPTSTPEPAKDNSIWWYLGGIASGLAIAGGVYYVKKGQYHTANRPPTGNRPSPGGHYPSPRRLSSREKADELIRMFTHPRPSDTNPTFLIREMQYEDLLSLTRYPNIKLRNAIVSGTINPNILESLAYDPDPKVRADVVWNESTPASVLSKLSTDQDPIVRRAVAQQWRAERHVLQALANDTDRETRQEARRNLDAQETAARNVQEFYRRHGR